MSTTDSDLGEVTYRRVFKAPRELVFACMTTPEHLAKFWGPTGVSTPIENIEVDLRPGGIFRTDMVNDVTGDVYATSGIFVTVEPPEKLVWTEPDVEGGMTTSVTFVDRGDGTTEAVTHQTNVPAMFRSSESQAGMESSFDKFDLYLATL